MLKHRSLSLFLVAAIVIFVYQVGNAIYNKKYLLPPESKAYSGTGFVINRNSVDLFDQIPPQYINAAANLRMLFIDRSVGSNINDGLTCLAFNSVNTAPSHCKRPSAEVVGYTPSSSYNRNNWTYQFWPSDAVEWEGSLGAFISTVTPRLNLLDVVSFQFSYLAVDNNSTITNPSLGFFAHTPQIKDVYDLNDFETNNPNKIVIYWTSSLARSIGTNVSQQFNESMRQYAVNNNKVLFDVADIESHAPNGQPCYDNRDGVYYSNGNSSENYPNDYLNIPALCQEYTTEKDGGHLGSVSAGKIRIAKAMWVLMARLAGWNPGVPQTTISTPIPLASQPSLPTPPAAIAIPATGKIHTGDLELNLTNAILGWRGSVFIIVHDENHRPVVGATVYGSFDGIGYNKTGSCITKSAGNCTLSSGIINNSINRVNFGVSDVVYLQNAYDVSQNHDVNLNSNGTNLTLNKP